MKLLERVAQPIIRAVEKRAREEGRAEEREDLATERETIAIERESLTRWKEKPWKPWVRNSSLPDEPQDREAEQPAC